MPISKRALAEMRGIGVGRGIERWTEGIMRRPTPATVANLCETHGYDACRERWWYIDKRTLSAMLSKGRRELMQSHPEPIA
jgi:hypothetical protein